MVCVGSHVLMVKTAHEEICVFGPQMSSDVHRCPYPRNNNR